MLSINQWCQPSQSDSASPHPSLPAFTQSILTAARSHPSLPINPNLSNLVPPPFDIALFTAWDRTPTCLGSTQTPASHACACFSLLRQVAEQFIDIAHAESCHFCTSKSFHWHMCLGVYFVVYLTRSNRYDDHGWERTRLLQQRVGRMDEKGVGRMNGKVEWTTVSTVNTSIINRIIVL